MTFEDAMVGATVRFKGKDGNDYHGIITSVFLNGGGGFAISLPNGNKISLYKERANDIPIMDIQVVEYKGFGVGDRVIVTKYNRIKGQKGVITKLYFGGEFECWCRVKTKVGNKDVTFYIPLRCLAKRTDKISEESIKSNKFRSYVVALIGRYLRKSEIDWSTLKWNVTTAGKLTTKVCSGGKEITGSAKCHPDDDFDIRIGVRLAVQRIKEQLGQVKWKPENGDEYWYVGPDNLVYFKFNTNTAHEEMAMLLNNCFRTRDDAIANVGKVRKRYKAVEEFLKGYDNE